MLHQFNLWDSPLRDVCQKAATRKVKDFMYSPTDGEFVDADAALDEAIHQLIMGHHQSLIVTRGDEIVGILKLSDIFGEICMMIKASQS